jgi:hypothetical protein
VDEPEAVTCPANDISTQYLKDAGTGHLIWLGSVIIWDICYLSPCILTRIWMYTLMKPEIRQEAGISGNHLSVRARLQGAWMAGRDNVQGGFL